MRISDWSSDVCSSDLGERHPPPGTRYRRGFRTQDQPNLRAADDGVLGPRDRRLLGLSAGGEISMGDGTSIGRVRGLGAAKEGTHHWRSEEHTSELQSLMRISYAVFCLKKKINYNNKKTLLNTHNKTYINIKTEIQ